MLPEPRLARQIVETLGQSGTPLSKGVSYYNAGNESLLGYFLPAGDYTIVASGAACNTSVAGCTGPFIIGTVNLSASPVPIPAALYLFGTGLVGLAGLARHRRKADL